MLAFHHIRRKREEDEEEEKRKEEKGLFPSQLPVWRRERTNEDASRGGAIIPLARCTSTTSSKRQRRQESFQLHSSFFSSSSQLDPSLFFFSPMSNNTLVDTYVSIHGSIPISISAIKCSKACSCRFFFKGFGFSAATPV